MKLEVLDQSGKKIEELEVLDSVFNAEVNESVLSQYTYIYLSNQREGNAKTKDKSEVSGGGKKPFKQKGTGRARAGSTRSPIWRKGGVTHGPTNLVNYKKSTTKNFRKAAIRSALSKIVKNGNLKLVSEFSFDKNDALTKKAVEVLKAFNNPRKVLIITEKSKPEVFNAFNNLKNATVKTVNKINTYDILTGGTILVEKSSLEYINKKWSK